jgi:phosphoglycerate kinase
MESKTLEGIKIIDEFRLDGKRVFLRLDLNVPIENGNITDDTRIQAALPTITYARHHGAKLVLASHLGRPTKPEDRKKLSLEPIAQCLQQQLDAEVILVEDPRSETPKALLAGLKKNQIILLENLRFDPGEEANDMAYAQAIAEYTDIYINDAFGASHRAHMSITRLPEVISEHGIGFLIKKEIEMMDRVRLASARPFLAILGGAKVSDKIKVLEKLVDRVDALMIGGAMAYTFLSAQGTMVGSSRVEKDKISFAKSLLNGMAARNKKVYLPVDHLVSRSFTDLSDLRETEGAAIDDGWMGLDIGPETTREFTEAVAEAKTIFWNGPMGVFERPELCRGTFAIAEAMANSGALTIVGGGDSAAAAEASGYAESLTHISTGGGASLEYLEGRKLPGLEALRPPKRSESGANETL